MKYFQGDTIIEVLLAITIFSMVAVGALSVMNSGLNTAQQALEITQVKQQIDSQASTLRAAHIAHVAAPRPTDAWNAILSQIGPSGSTGTATFNGSTCPDIPSGSFGMNPRAGTIQTTLGKMDGSAIYPYSGVWYADAATTAVTQARGIWIEASRVGAGGFPAARDFTIRACWNVTGSPVPQTLETLVRLYEP